MANALPDGAADPLHCSDGIPQELKPTEEERFQFRAFNPFKQGTEAARGRQDDSVGNEIQRMSDSQHAEKKRLIPLENIRSDAAKHFLGPPWRFAQFGVIEGANNFQFYPKQCAQNWQGATLRCRISGGDIAPTLRFELAIRSSVDHEKILHTAYLEFGTSIPEEFSKYDFEIQKIVDEDGKDKEKKKKFVAEDYLIGFTTTGGVGCGLDFQHVNFSRDTTDTLKFMNSLTQVASTAKRQVHVKFPFQSGKAGTQGAFKEALMKMQHPPSLHWMPYRDAGGNPLTQYGMFANRQAVKDDSGGHLIQYPPRHYFSSLDEGRILLTYGSALEFQQQCELYEAIGLKGHRACFLSMGGRGVLVLVRLNLEDLPEDLYLEENISIREGTLVTLEWWPQGQTRHKASTCTAMVMPDMFNIAGSDTVMSVVGKSVKYFTEAITDIREKERKYYLVHIKFHQNNAGVRRQVDAVNQLCVTPNWQQVFLNHSSMLPVVNPIEGLELAQEAISDAKRKVLESIPLAKEQRVLLDKILEMPGGILWIEGFPGCGKTKTMSAIVTFLSVLGVHVILAAPTHAAADVFCFQVSQTLKTMGIEEEPIRAYGGVAEMEALFKENRDVRRATNAKDVDNEALDDAIATMLYLTNTFKKKTLDAKRGLITMSVEARAVQMAKAGTAVIMAEYPPPPRRTKKVQIFDSDGHQDTEELDEESSDEETSDEEAGDEKTSDAGNTIPHDAPNGPVNMVHELKRYLEKMETEDPKTWEEDDKRKLRYSFKVVSQSIMAKARIVSSTNNNLAGELIRQYFGTDAKAVVLFRDEDSKELEASGWVGITKMACSDKIKGIVLGGDTKQLRPTVISHTSTPRKNEFSAQLTVSFPERLKQVGFPSVQLVEQHRMRPELAEFPNRRVYNGLMRNADNVKSIKVDPNYIAMLRDFTGERKPNAEMGNVMLSVKDAVCNVDQNKSRYNLHHVRLIVEILVRNHKYSGYDAKDVCIMTPYKAQKTRIHNALYTLAKLNILPLDQHPAVKTIDAMQGDEYPLVIADMVVTDGSRGGLGFMSDENRCNVAFTRAKAALLIIMAQEVGRVTEASNDKTQPFLVELAQDFAGDKRVYSVKPADFTVDLGKAFEVVTSEQNTSSFNVPEDEWSEQAPLLEVNVPADEWPQEAPVVESNIPVEKWSAQVESAGEWSEQVGVPHYSIAEKWAELDPMNKW
ncbi:hypothetical protein PRK78_004156 [Emydomyces testavorans]|uniref:Uncharacterized protein n=1 Tax=Emydomyces testavorans TaxID=2070801 RepID=A0AAF0DI95_9EURO|nr:hypothetical protein PRK78_004156 [Emydomyces testavorans]